MLPDPQDTIVAVASPPPPAARAILRLSGPKALALVQQLFTSPAPLSESARALIEGALRLPGLAADVPADLYFWPAPSTYTGQELVELHMTAAQPLVSLVISQLLAAGARAAQPGEFTLRAFLNGKLDLTRAEAVLGIINATSRDDLQTALVQLAGGMSRPLQELRSDLLDLLAETEAALDFAEEEVPEAETRNLLHRLAAMLAQVTVLGKQLERRAVERRPFRVVLTGHPNAGKSSLFNAVCGAAEALVGPAPGTTRDYLHRRVHVDGVELELVDTAGRRAAGDTIEEQAQNHAVAQVEGADLVVFCRDVTTTDQSSPHPDHLVIDTKSDLGGQRIGTLATSTVSGTGIAELRSLLAERARLRPTAALLPSVSRCRAHVQGCLEALRRAHAVVLYEDPRELLALELRGALEELGALVGAVYTDDILDRIFSRFCIGK